LGAIEAQLPPQKIFLIMDLKMAICGTFLVHFFAVQLKLSGGEKILSPRYIFIGGHALSPPGIDATAVNVHGDS